MKRIFLIILSLLIVLPLIAKDQQEFLEIKTRYGFKIKRRQPLNFNVFLSSDPVSSRPVLFAAVSVQNDILQFKKDHDAYTARYRISIAVRNDASSILQFSRKHSLTLDNFKQTNSIVEHQSHSYRLDNWNTDAELTQGKYICLLEVEDLITRKTSTKNLILHVTSDFAERKSSPICFLTAHPDSSLEFPLAPHLNHLNYNQNYFAYAHFKTDSESPENVQLRLLRQEEILVDSLIEVQPESGRTEVLFPLPVDILSEGSYRLEMKHRDISENRNFKIAWFRKPVYLYELDLALRPMRYLLPEEEYEQVEDLGRVELEDWFRNFWQEQDPTPKTVYNELQYEYFQRVGESNYKFRSKAREGWETDRGKVFILYGPPEKIENGRYASQSLPYLVWEYADSLNFVFVDQKRNGEFVLKNMEEKE